MATEDWRALNRAHWDERVRMHLGPGGYDLTALREGRDRLNAIEEAELGSVDGLRVLHLQCHSGGNTPILAQHGAEVVGLDFSAPAIDAARRLAAERPAALVLYDERRLPDGNPGYCLPYFQREPLVYEAAADYVDRTARLAVQPPSQLDAPARQHGDSSSRCQPEARLAARARRRHLADVQPPRRRA